VRTSHSRKQQKQRIIRTTNQLPYATVILTTRGCPYAVASTLAAAAARARDASLFFWKNADERVLRFASKRCTVMQHEYGSEQTSSVSSH
jgi:hypothetical protein